MLLGITLKIDTAHYILCVIFPLNFGSNYWRHVTDKHLQLIYILRCFELIMTIDLSDNAPMKVRRKHAFLIPA